jgi:Domain of unknown function (DUF5668)
MVAMDDPNVPDPTQVSPAPPAPASPAADAATGAAPPPPQRPTPQPVPPTPPPAPSWDAPRRTNEGRWVGMFFGLILLAVGLWYFAERTLGLEMPDLDAGQLWPLILIGLGAVILYSGLRRDRR